MYDSTDGKKAGILKNVDCTCGDSVTVSNNDSLVYAEVPESPEFKEPIIMNTPRYSPPINPDYLKLAQIGFDYILQTMIEGEKTHPDNEWKEKASVQHWVHAKIHMSNYKQGDKSEDHIACCMARCAMIKFLEGEKK
jgi:hypothetical protein